MSYIHLSILSALLFALTFFFRRLASKTLPFQAALLIEVIVAVILFGLALWFISPDLPKSLTLKNKGITYALIAGIIMTLGLTANFLALKSGPLAKVIAITSPSQIIFGVFLGLLLLKETLSLKSTIGIILSILGIILMAG